MQIPGVEISVPQIELFARSVCALSEAFGMNAENQMRAATGNSPAYNEADFNHLAQKWDLVSYEIDELLSDSEKEFLRNRQEGNIPLDADPEKYGCRPDVLAKLENPPATVSPADDDGGAYAQAHAEQAQLTLEDQLAELGKPVPE